MTTARDVLNAMRGLIQSNEDYTAQVYDITKRHGWSVETDATAYDGVHVFTLKGSPASADAVWKEIESTLGDLGYDVQTEADGDTITVSVQEPK